MIAHPDVLVQLRNKLVADVDSFDVLEDKTRHLGWLGCGGQAESSGRGMYKRDAGELGKPRMFRKEVRS